MKERVFFVALSMGLCVAARAALVAPISYDMLNGDGQASGGSYNYWDASYSGTGSVTQDRAPLAGGLGDLTDGVIATQNWFAVETVAGTGPYVGWRGLPSTFQPTVTFHFQPGAVIQRVTVYADDSDGNGGVSLPDAVLIGGASFDVDQSAPGSEPKVLQFDLPTAFSGASLDVQFVRSNEWVFVSEVQFDGVVPEPASLAALGVGAFALARRRRRG